MKMDEQPKVDVVKIFAGATVVDLAVLFVLTVPTGVGTAGQWFVAAGVGLGTVLALLWHERNRGSLHERELRSLRRAIDRSQGQWFRLQLHWLGREIRLTEDFWWLDDWGERAYTIPAGTLGQIAGLTMNPARPFYVRFPAVSERMLVDPNTMEIDPLPVHPERAREPA